MSAKLQPWGLSTNREDTQDRDLAPIFGDLSQSEKLSDIKPPLEDDRCLLVTIADAYPANVIFWKSWSFFWIS